MKKGKGKQKQKLKVCFYLLQTSPANKQILKKKNELKDEVIAKVKQPGNMILFFKILNLDTAIFRGRNGRFRECKSKSLRMSRNELI